MYLEADTSHRVATTNRRIEFGLVPPEVMQRALADANSGLTTDAVESASARHEECFGAWTSQQLISYLWLAPSGTHLCQDVHVHYATAYAYIRWAHTRDEYRGQHLHSITKHHALD